MRRMVNMVRTRRNSTGESFSPRAAEVGEIDTKAPFQSVRAAVSLFGEASSPKARPLITKKATSPTQGVLDKEAQFHLALNELNKLKEQLRGAELARAETLPELNKAKKTLDELRDKLRHVNESKQSILEASEALNNKVKQLKELVVDSEEQIIQTQKEEYNSAIVELDATKQELSNLRREIASASEAKLSALRKAQQAELAADAHRDRVKELSKQAADMQQGLAKIRDSSAEAIQGHEKFLAQKDEELRLCRVAKEEVAQKLLSLREEHQSLLGDDLELKIAEANTQIAFLQEQVRDARTTFLEAQKATSFELEMAKGSLKEVEEEKKSLQMLVESLKKELEHVGKQLSEQKRKEDDLEAVANRIRAEIQDKKNELESSLVNKTSAADTSDDMVSSLEQLIELTQKTKKEAEEVKKETEEQTELARATREMAIEMEKKLPSVLEEVEEAKSSEIRAQGEIKTTSQRSDVDTASTGEGNGRIKVSNEEHNSMLEKVNESEKLADIKVAATMAHVETLVANQQEAAKKYEAYSKAIEELKTAEEEALKAAEMAEAATSALEAELHRLRQEEDVNQTTLPN